MEQKKVAAKSQADKVMVCPVVPVREIVVYPYMVVSMNVVQDTSHDKLRDCFSMGKQVIFLLEKNPEAANANESPLYDVGVVANILQVDSKTKEGEVKMVVEGAFSARVLEEFTEGGTQLARVERIEMDERVTAREQRAWQTLVSLFEDYAKLHRKLPSAIVKMMRQQDQLARSANIVAAHMSSASQEQRQQFIAEVKFYKRIKLLTQLVSQEIALLQVDERVKNRVKQQLNKVQHEYYLNEKLKAVQHELNELNENSGGTDLEKLRKKVDAAGMPKEVREKADQELSRLAAVPSFSPEAGVISNYLEWLTALPWSSENGTGADAAPSLKEAEQILTKEHYGLEKVNERILEYLAVQSRSKNFKGPILCLVGPPGVGKTSLGESIARATGRKFIRLSLGGVRDEAEIRGHRRTYVGAMPGRIIQKLAKAKVKNPLFMLDELDKLVNDYHGDPAAALLEVLDPEQNRAFDDHYLEVSYDLSEVMFIATANSLNLPNALLDRLEIIRVAGYTEEEKIKIARDYLLPKQLEEHGLRAAELKIASSVYPEIIRNYTREAGVRQLGREIAKLCRKVVRRIVCGDFAKETIDKHNLASYLGVPRYDHEKIKGQSVVGEVNGLAWTETGGELLVIEAVAVPGKGKANYTGRLGDVMQESIQAAVTVLRTLSARLGLDHKIYEECDIHIHVPDGATPKDGPSAGAAMCTALVSTFTKVPVRHDIAMTGEINLAGEILPIGGLKEKLLAAQSAGIKKVFIPERNHRELVEMPESLVKALTIVPVRNIKEVLLEALVRDPFLQTSHSGEQDGEGKQEAAGKEGKCLKRKKACAKTKATAAKLPLKSATADRSKTDGAEKSKVGNGQAGKTR